MAALLIILLAVAAYSVPDAGERAILEQFYNGTVTPHDDMSAANYKQINGR
jgi:hypothetical protein